MTGALILLLISAAAMALRAALRRWRIFQAAAFDRANRAAADAELAQFAPVRRSEQSRLRAMREAGL
jgi:hypothetical protein